MRATMLDLRKNPKRVLKALDHNEEVTLTYRGKRKAIIVPLNHGPDDASVSDHPAFGLWRGHKDGESVGAFVRKLRQGRTF